MLEAKVMVVLTTASPSPMPRAASAMCMADVAELTASAAGAPTSSANSLSKRCARWPVVIQPSRSVCTTSLISSSPIRGGAKGRNVDRISGLYSPRLPSLRLKFAGPPSVPEQAEQVAAHRRQCGQHRVGGRGQRRQNGQRAQRAPQLREEPAHPAGRDGVDVAVGRAVVAEVVPEEPGAWPHDADYLARDVGRHPSVEDRAEDGDREHEVEAPVRERKVLRVAGAEVEEIGRASLGKECRSRWS